MEITKKTGIEGINLIKYWESKHDGDLNKIGLQPKLCPADIWTTGYGHAIIDPDTGKYIKADTPDGYTRACQLYPDLTDREADDLLKKDLLEAESKVNRWLKVEVNQNQFDALISHCYNCGYSKTMYQLVNNMNLGISNLNKGDIGSHPIYKWFTEHYITANGEVLKGLVDRRKDEALLFFQKQILTNK